MFNSTIKQRVDICPLCSPDKGKQPLIAGKCNYHYWLNSRMKSAIKQQEKEIHKDDDFSTLVADLDIIFSRFIRLKDADLYKKVSCYCCGKEDDYKYMDAGHFIPRGHLYTRWNENNVKSCCQHCNRMKDGNLAAFARHLEKDNPGSVEILQEQARIVYHYTREELKSMIADYTKKVKLLLP